MGVPAWLPLCQKKRVQCPTSTPGRSSPLSLVDESRPHPRPLYCPRLAPPHRRLLFRPGEAWPSLSKVAVIRLPLRRAFPL